MSGLNRWMGFLLLLLLTSNMKRKSPCESRPAHPPGATGDGLAAPLLLYPAGVARSDWP